MTKAQIKVIYFAWGLRNRISLMKPVGQYLMPFINIYYQIFMCTPCISLIVQFPVVQYGVFYGWYWYLKRAFIPFRFSVIIFHQEQKRKRSLLAEYFIKLAAILYGKVLVDACIIVRSLFLLCLPIHFLLYHNSLVYKTVTTFPVFYEPNLKVTSLDGHEQKLINHYTAISYKK